MPGILRGLARASQGLPQAVQARMTRQREDEATTRAEAQREIQNARMDLEIAMLTQDSAGVAAAIDRLERAGGISEVADVPQMTPQPDVITRLQGAPAPENVPVLPSAGEVTITGTAQGPRIDPRARGLLAKIERERAAQGEKSEYVRWKRESEMSRARQWQGVPGLKNYAVRQAEDGSWEMKRLEGGTGRPYVNTTTGYIYDPNIGKSRIDPLAQQAKRDLIDYRFEKESDLRAATANFREHHLEMRLRADAVKRFQSRSDDLLDKLVAGTLTPDEVLAHMDVAASQYRDMGMKNPEAVTEPVKRMVQEIGRLNLKFNASQITYLGQAFTMQDAAEDLLTMLDDPDVVAGLGRVGGTWARLTASLTGDAVAPPELQEFAFAYDRLRLAMLKIESGATVSEQERQTYEKLYGTQITNPRAIRSRMGAMLDFSDQQITGLYEAALTERYRGYDQVPEEEWERIPTRERRTRGGPDDDALRKLTNDDLVE